VWKPLIFLLLLSSSLVAQVVSANYTIGFVAEDTSVNFNMTSATYSSTDTITSYKGMQLGVTTQSFCADADYFDGRCPLPASTFDLIRLILRHGYTSYRDNMRQVWTLFQIVP
jgi:hypothetical protein